MNLHLRKMFTGQVEQSKQPGRHTQQDTLGLDYYENEIAEAFSEDSEAAALGMLTVLAADVLEIARRADPAYGLVPVQSLYDLANPDRPRRSGSDE